MAEKYLIDTSAIIKYINETLSTEGLVFMDETIEKESTISFISEIELQVWNPPNPQDIKIYQSFISGSNVTGISPEIINETIQIRKNHKLRMPDAIIAATAIVNGLTLIADNDNDFDKVTGLGLINPRKMGGA